ncbi:MAG: DHA2 family efflux MFS transporter permease subunit [Candidatus Gastranaerophilales bacterium]|nr:DHA2 family efflux MFS transporter permease subunit [Candidatus Gastranaerophilales bacterium]
MPEKKPNPYIIAAVMILPTFFAMVATSGTNVCMPYIAGFYGATQNETNTVITSYMISNGAMLPLTGWLVKAFGEKKTALWCIYLFTIGAFMCAVSPNLPFLIISRLIEGIGGGPLMPLSQSVLLSVFPKEKRGTAMGLFGFAVILSPLIGPVLGGYLTDNYGWQWVFIINIPFCLLAIYLIKKYLKDPVLKPVKQKLDVVGLVLISIALGTMQIVLDKGEQNNWLDCTWIAWTAGISFFAFIFFFIWELEYKDSFAKLRIFENRNFAVGTFLGGIVNLMVYSTILLVPLFVQNILGYNATLSGFAVSARIFSCMIMLVVVGQLANIIDNRLLIAIGSFIMGVSTFMFAGMNPTSSMASIVIPNFIFGSGIAFTFIPMSAMTFATISSRKIADGAGLHSLYKCVLTAFVTTACTTFVQRMSQLHQTYLAHNITKSSLIYQHHCAALKSHYLINMSNYMAGKKAVSGIYKQMLMQAKLCAFYDLFLILALIAICAIPLVLLLQPRIKEARE